MSLYLWAFGKTKDNECYLPISRIHGLISAVRHTRRVQNTQVQLLPVTSHIPSLDLEHVRPDLDTPGFDFGEILPVESSAPLADCSSDFS